MGDLGADDVELAKLSPPQRRAKRRDVSARVVEAVGELNRQIKRAALLGVPVDLSIMDAEEVTTTQRQSGDPGVAFLPRKHVGPRHQVVVINPAPPKSA